jgi:hypothetical protein
MVMIGFHNGQEIPFNVMVLAAVSAKTHVHFARKHGVTSQTTVIFAVTAAMT